MCCICSYAKESGLSYDLVSGAGASQFISAVLQTAAVGCALFFLFEVPLLDVVLPFAISTFAMVVLALVSKRKIGGVTGDVLGSCCEICETFTLAFCVFLN